jgi:PmbA protein
MDWKTFKDRVFSISKKKGFEEAELYYARGSEFQLSSLKGEIDSYNDATSSGVYFRGLKTGKIGAAFTEILDEEAADMLVDEAYENLLIASGKDIYFLHDGSGQYSEFNGFSGAFATQPVEDKIEKVITLERAALGYDKRIIMVPSCRLADSQSEVTIVNTLGLERHYRADGGYAVIVSLAGEGNSKKTGFTFAVARKPDDIDVLTLGREASKRAVEQLGAGKVKSGKYRVLLRNDVFGQFFGTFTSMYSAEYVHKGLSILAGKEGTKIASEHLSVYDDPFLPSSPGSRPFDDEGVPTKVKGLVENGVLKTFLYDLKTAAKDGRESTGNAIKPNYRSKPSISTINTVIKPGKKDFQELLKELGDGIVVTDLTGLHSGANPVSGEFSLGASGFLVKNGEIVNPIEQFTVSSSILKVYNSIEAVGSDSMPSIFKVMSPSVVISEVDVASE